MSAKLDARKLGSSKIGGDFEVPTIDGGKTRVKVPEGTQSGRRFRLQGKGMGLDPNTVAEYLEADLDTVALHEVATVGLPSTHRVPSTSTYSMSASRPASRRSPSVATGL
jgi:hypothetical protein